MTLNLNYEGFEDVLIKQWPDMGGIHYLFRFDNGYGASVVKFRGSYGHMEDLWELAVLIFDEGSDDYELTYDTEITQDVLGYLTDEDVRDLLERIKGL